MKLRATLAMYFLMLPSVCVVAPRAFAGLVTNDGYTGQLHVLFLTFSRSTGNIGGVSGADLLVNANAASAGSVTSGLGLNFVAMISGNGQDMNTLIGDSFPIYNTRGDRVANSFAALFSPQVSPFTSFAFNQFGTSAFSGYWTGSNIEGLEIEHTCSDWHSDSNLALGQVGLATSSLTPIEFNAFPCDRNFSLAGISTDTTIGIVPEPSSFLYFGLIALGFVGMKLKAWLFYRP